MKKFKKKVRRRGREGETDGAEREEESGEQCVFNVFSIPYPQPRAKPSGSHTVVNVPSSTEAQHTLEVWTVPNQDVRGEEERLHVLHTDAQRRKCTHRVHRVLQLCWKYTTLTLWPPPNIMWGGGLSSVLISFCPLEDVSVLMHIVGVGSSTELLLGPIVQAGATYYSFSSELVF